MSKRFENSTSLKGKLLDLKREIKADWHSYKRERALLHGEDIQDNKLDMLLVHLIRKGIL